MAVSLLYRGTRTVTLVSLMVSTGRASPRGLSNALHLRAGVAENEEEQTIYFVRHAEGWHNKHSAELANWHSDKLGLLEKYRDANLTPLGESQCAELAARLEGDESWVKPELVVVSPLTRTIRTATLSFQDGPYPFVATELARERIAHHKCDQRSPLSSLKGAWSHVDFSHVAHDDDVMWETKENHPSELNSTRCSERALELLQWLRNRPERRIAVVSHWVFLKHLFALFPDQPAIQEKFGNAEMRTVVLSDAFQARAPAAAGASCATSSHLGQPLAAAGG